MGPPCCPYSVLNNKRQNKDYNPFLEPSAEAFLSGCRHVRALARKPSLPLELTMTSDKVLRSKFCLSSRNFKLNKHNRNTGQERALEWADLALGSMIRFV